MGLYGSLWVSAYTPFHFSFTVPVNKLIAIPGKSSGFCLELVLEHLQVCQSEKIVLKKFENNQKFVKKSW